VSVNAQFVALAANPDIIPGVHHYCDEWCDYCPVRARCLEYRCTEAYRRSRGRKAHDPTFANVAEAVAFTRELAAAEGERTDELDALVACGPAQSGVDTSDPLAETAWRYAERVAELMQPLIVRPPDDPPATPPATPSPEDVVLWYQLRIYMKIFRALVARESHPGGPASDEARGFGKLALVSIDRSLAAFAQLRERFPAAEVRMLERTLTLLRDGLEQRIPGARGFLRIGLDYPAAPA
jgi:hypothetical protein